MSVYRLFAAALAIVLLSGCAGTPPSSNRYTLPVDATASGTPSVETRHTLVVRPLRLANYLDSEGIVMQLDDITLTQAREHRWAEDLSRQLERGLRQRLADRLPDTRVLGEETPGSDALSLRLEVERFQGRHDGMAVAGGQWQLRGPDGQVMVQEPFLAEVELDADGYPSLIRALGRSWDRVADRLASRIRELR